MIIETSGTCTCTCRFVVCSHVYCRDCMASYFTERISSGAVTSLTCPTAGCDTQALPTQVRCSMERWCTMAQVAEVVAEELYTRYEHQLLETQLESMADVVSCPRWGRPWWWWWWCWLW